MMIIAQLQPVSMVLTGLVLLMALIWFFWPKKGGFAKYSILKRNNQRIHLEDALKFMFDCEYRKVNCDINGIADNMNVTADKAGRIINRLITLDLISMQDHSISLTDTGRSYALRVIRVHRIWERYLADETSVAQADWHKEACRIEHQVSLEDTEKLAVQLGNPVFDPHGDPIPTPEGALPEPRGKPLSKMRKGEMGQIIHMEDEPQNIYEQLVVLGLYPGMQVYVTVVTDNKITFVAEGEEYVLTRLFAGYITVEELAAEIEQAPKHELLSSLRIGEQAEILGISPNCHGQQRRRLMDLGIVPGSRISVVIKSASGDPVGYRVMGTTIGIRKQQAELIFINRQNNVPHEQHESM